MKFIDNIRQLMGISQADGKVILKAKCSGFNCGQIFVVQMKNPAGSLPEKLICSKCEERFNQGIRQYVHAHSGYTEGNYHIIDGYSKG